MNEWIKDYRRVVPRDLFNESKLLKCLGFMVLYTNANVFSDYGLEFNHKDDEDFKFFFTPKIKMNESDGSIICTNLEWRSDNYSEIVFFTPMASEYTKDDPFPFYAIFDDFEYVEVFEGKGKPEPTQEFLEKLEGVE